MSLPPLSPATLPRRRAAVPAVSLRPVTLRESLGSAWSLRWAAALPLAIPMACLVVLQEAVTERIDVALVVLSVLLQQAFHSFLLLGLASVLRRMNVVLPLLVSVALGCVLGVGRGLISGLVASGLGGVVPEYEFRIVFWVLMAVVWEPLVLHTASQLHHRRQLLSNLATEVAQRDEARRQADRTSNEIREHLIEAVRGSIGPAVDEITRSLRVVSPAVDKERIRLIGERLATLSSESTRLVERLSEPIEQDPPRHTDGVAPLVTVLDFEYRRPILSIALGAVALLALLVPLSLQREPREIVLQIIVSVAVSSLGMVIAFGSKDRERRAMTGFGTGILRYVIAGLLASTALLLFRLHDMTSFVVVLLLVLPVGVVVSSVTVAAAVGLPESNRELLRVAAEVKAERWALAEDALQEENDVRVQLSDLMHGPIQGRLAACAMALNFHSAEIDSAPEGRTDFITATVLTHLEAASNDLVGLSRAVDR